MTLQKKVYIARGAFLGSVIRMFKERGWHVSTTIEDADFLCLTGGADIMPSMYGERTLSMCYPDPKQDAYDQDLIEKFKDKPKLGICRGGQILNVVSGGKMWQHVDNHESRPHPSIDIRTKKTVLLSSIHHQMMIPADDDVEVIAVASESKNRHAYATSMSMAAGTGTFENDIEVLYYPKTQALCFQPHPEVGPKECTDYFFDLIDEKFPEIAGQKTNNPSQGSLWADLEANITC